MSSSGRNRRWEESREEGRMRGRVMKGGKENRVQTGRNRSSGIEKKGEREGGRSVEQENARSQRRKTGGRGEKGVEDGGSW